MADQWVLLTPTGVDVEVYPGAQVPVPTLVTRQQLLAVANAVAELRKANIEADLGAMLAALARPAQSPGQEVLPLDDGGGAVHRVVPAQQRHACSCGIGYTSELLLFAHQREHPDHDPKWLPPEARVD